MESDYIIGRIPLPVAAATAIWFGVMAYKAGKNRALWAIGGFVLGLVVSTIVLGLAQATFIPFSTDQITPFRVGMAGLAILVILGAGWLFTGALHRHLSAAFKRRPEPPPEVPAKAPAASLKP